MGLVHAFEELLGLAPTEAGEPAPAPATPAEPAAGAVGAGGAGEPPPTGQLMREDEDRKAREREAREAEARFEQERSEREQERGERERERAERAAEPPPAPEPAPAPETYPGQSFPIPPGVYGPPGPGGVTPYEGPGVRVGPRSSLAKQPIRNPHR